MLVSELRETLKKYKEEELRTIVVEMYKSMPKKLREDRDVDTLVQDIRAYKNRGGAGGAQKGETDIDSLKAQIDLFIDYAYNQCYCAPNSYVHKKERPKWRFKVRAFIKDLRAFPADSEGGKIATDLLQKLYEMLSYGCAYFIFNTDNPFRSVGIEQTKLLDVVISRKLGSGINKGQLKSAIELVLNSYVDRETLHSFLILIFTDNLKTPDAREAALEQCELIKMELKRSKPDLKKGRHHDYKHEEKLNNLTEIVFRINIALYEYEQAIRYFHKYYTEWNPEVSLFVLLDLLRVYELKKYWLREYEEAVKRGIKPRESLQRVCVHIQKNGEFPEHIYL